MSMKYSIFHSCITIQKINWRKFFLQKNNRISLYKQLCSSCTFSRVCEWITNSWFLHWPKRISTTNTEQIFYLFWNFHLILECFLFTIFVLFCFTWIMYDYIVNNHHHHHRINIEKLWCNRWLCVCLCADSNIQSICAILYVH